MKACVAVLACAAALAASSLAVAQARAAAASAPGCVTSTLVIWLDTQGDGTAGSIFYKLHLANLSGHTCTLEGYPRIFGAGLGGHRLGSPASHDNAHSPSLVNLAAGGTATAVLRIVEAGNFPAAACHRVTAAALRVFPPQHATSKLVPFPFQACSRSGPVYLTVEAVTR